MTELFAIIRTAIAPNASREARAAGARACRTLIAALDARAERRRAAPPDAALREIPSERLLEMAMAKTRASVQQRPREGLTGRELCPRTGPE